MRGFEQKDPLVVYKKEAFEMFNGLLESIQDDMVNWMFHLVVRQPEPPPRRRVINTLPDEAETEAPAPRPNGARPPAAASGAGAASVSALSTAGESAMATGVAANAVPAAATTASRRPFGRAPVGQSVVITVPSGRR